MTEPELRSQRNRLKLALQFLETRLSKYAGTTVDQSHRRKRIAMVKRALRINEVRLIIAMRESIIESKPAVDPAYVRRYVATQIIGVVVAVGSAWVVGVVILG